MPRVTERPKTLTCSAAYLKRRNEHIAAFLLRCSELGFADLHVYVHRDFPDGSRERPILFVDETFRLHLASFWQDRKSGEFQLEPSAEFLEREQYLNGLN